MKCNESDNNIEKSILPTVNKARIDFDIYRGVMVYCENEEDEIGTMSLELLNEGRRLANILNVKLIAVIFFGEHKEIEQETKTLIAHGANEVYVLLDANLKYFNDELYAFALENAINLIKPEILLIGATNYGRSLAPRVATGLNTGLTADCTMLDIDVANRVLLQTRPAWSGNIMATIRCEQKRPQICTIRQNVMGCGQPDFSRCGNTTFLDIQLPKNIRTKVIDSIINTNNDVSIKHSDIVVAGGYGMKNAKNFGLLKVLARLIGGCVGASREAVTAGWAPNSIQVGQTGKTISPKIYIACGISGASQHIAGMSSSDIIVAINNNPEAEIFKIATYGIVGDAQEVVNAMINELKSRPNGLYK